MPGRTHVRTRQRIYIYIQVVPLFLYPSVIIIQVGNCSGILPGYQPPNGDTLWGFKAGDGVLPG